MVLVPAGTFRMGSDHHYPEERPARDVTVDAFLIDPFPVTNRQFGQFVAETGYVTVAEQTLDPGAFPGAPPENLVPGSLVFTMTRGPVDLRHLSQWWTWTPGACWKRPDGPRSGLAGREDEPVVHVAFEDAAAYASWVDKDLPTEAEWERAARGGLAAAAYVWGDDPEVPGEQLANYWHGDFPWRADKDYGRRSPVGSYPPNSYGLYDMAGNVWEWTKDWYVERGTAEQRPCCVPGGQADDDRERSYDPTQPQFRIARKVVKGGSYLCADTYCHRYRPAARRPQMVDTGTSHIGFRCVTRTAEAT